MKRKCTDCPYVRDASFHCPEEEGYICAYLAMANGYNPAKLGGG